MFNCTNSLYGNYRTRTYADVFPDFKTFSDEWEATVFARTLDDSLPVELVWTMLYARYGNSSVAASDENRFKYQLFSIMFQYGPSWRKELEIQQELRLLNIDEFRKGATNIVNNAQNPSAAPTTQTTEELNYINQQNVSKTKRSTADAYALILSLLKDDVSENFLRRFEKLFITVVEPERPLWYADYNTED